MKTKDFYNIYTQSYLRLSNSDKYNAYHDLYLKLNNEIQKYNEIQNILFVNQTINDIDYLTFLSEGHGEHNFYMSGINLTKFNNKYYFDRINDIYNNYEFLSFNYQPKFNKENWKILKKEFKKINVIFLACKVVSNDNFSHFNNKKLVKFIKKFANAKIIGIGFDFSKIDKNIKNKKSNSIMLEEFISINTNN